MRQAFFSLGPMGEKEEDPAKAAAKALKEMLDLEEDTQWLVEKIQEAMEAAQAKYEEIKQEIVTTAEEVRKFAEGAGEFFKWVRDTFGPGRGEAASAHEAAARTSVQMDNQARAAQAQGRLPHWRGYGGDQGGLTGSEAFWQGFWRAAWPFGR
jgi:hypothetical protein